MTNINNKTNKKSSIIGHHTHFGYGSRNHTKLHLVIRRHRQWCISDRSASFRTSTDSTSPIFTKANPSGTG